MVGGVWALGNAYGWTTEDQLEKSVPWCPSNNASPHYETDISADDQDLVNFTKDLLQRRGWANIHEDHLGHETTDLHGNPVDLVTISAHYCFIRHAQGSSPTGRRS